MNMTSHTRTLRLTGLAFALAALAGCSTLKSPSNESATASGPLSANLSNDTPEINSVAEPVCSPAALATLAAVLGNAEQKAAITQTVFHFATDKSDLQADTTGVLTAHAALLNQQAALRLKVTVHTDERGTADYNLALGERRANTVATFLAAAGVKPTQMRVVSYGEEKPVASGGDETAWAQNRRAELIYTGCAQ